MIFQQAIVKRSGARKGKRSSEHVENLNPSSGQWSKGTKVKVLFLVKQGKRKTKEFFPGVVFSNKGGAVTINFDDGETVKYPHLEMDTKHEVRILEQEAHIKMTNDFLHLLSVKPGLAGLSNALDHMFQDDMANLHKQMDILLNADTRPETRKIEQKRIVGLLSDIFKQTEMFQLDTADVSWVRNVCDFGNPDSPLDMLHNSDGLSVGSAVKDISTFNSCNDNPTGQEGNQGPVCPQDMHQRILKKDHKPLRSADMHLCRIAVVHKRFWKAYRDRLKLVEFRSPYQLIRFFYGMILLLSMNAAERRRGRTELVMAVVDEIVLLSCEEACARFPVEAKACHLESLCKAWSGNNMVQCLVLNKTSMRVAHEICNLSVGNLGMLRQINDRACTARFCPLSDLGKTALVRLSTGAFVSCKYTVTWPNVVVCSRRRLNKDGDMFTSLDDGGRAKLEDAAGDALLN